MYIKPKLVNNWPQVRDDTEIVPQRIRDAMNEYSNKNKMKIEMEKLTIEDNNEDDEKRESIFKNLKVLEKK